MGETRTMIRVAAASKRADHSYNYQNTIYLILTFTAQAHPCGWRAAIQYQHGLI
ncbi:MAG TPA: hypothetical protein VEP90_26030 [Methylomirabilota bacterium]|nr:hypothetical protein [Methylomirabilota bacterium]